MAKLQAGSKRRARCLFLAAFALSCWSVELDGAEIVAHPFVGVTSITRTETSPRNLTMHIVEIDLAAPGIRFELTPPSGTLETIRQTTLDFLKQVHAQVAVNAHYFVPFPSTDLNASVVGLAVSNGTVYSSFEMPTQSYAIVANAPAINIDSSNHASIVHNDTNFTDGKHIREKVELWNTVAGSAQVITNGVKTIPTYADSSNARAVLTAGGPRSYSNSHSWYDLLNARTAIGISRDNQTLVLFTVDRAGGSLGMTVGEVAEVLIRDYGVYNALNLDGGGSTTLAMENPVTHEGEIVNRSSDNPKGRAVASSLAIFATLPPEKVGN